MRPAVLATRATFPDIADRLRDHFDVSDNPADTVWSPTELIARLQGKQGVPLGEPGVLRVDANRSRHEQLDSVLTWLGRISTTTSR